LTSSAAKGFPPVLNHGRGLLRVAVFLNDFNMEKQTFNSHEAARYLCVSRSKLMKMCHRRELRYSKAGRINVFFEDDLKEYLKSHQVLTADELKEQAEERLLNAKTCK
jgi:excisionase family DNA binding protein